LDYIPFFITDDSPSSIALISSASLADTKNNYEGSLLLPLPGFVSLPHSTNVTTKKQCFQVSPILITHLMLYYSYTNEQNVKLLKWLAGKLIVKVIYCTMEFHFQPRLLQS
jgi:hypothetical protein